VTLEEVNDIDVIKSKQDCDDVVDMQNDLWRRARFGTLRLVKSSLSCRGIENLPQCGNQIIYTAHCTA